MEEQILIMWFTICVLFLIIAFFSSSKNKREIDAIMEDLSKVKFEGLELERFVNIKMQSGEVFRDVTMEEYESINDPMKKGSYRIHRNAIESEFHFTKGTGSFEFEGKNINVKAYGDENGNIEEVYTTEIVSEKPYIDDVKWYFNKEGLDMMSLYCYSLEEKFYEFEQKGNQ